MASRSPARIGVAFRVVTGLSYHDEKAYLLVKWRRYSSGWAKKKKDY